jgi:predicted DNA-binding WGR domain protein
MTMPNATTKRRFEFVAGSSDKFWKIEIATREVTVRFGRRGTNGQTNTKTFPEEVAAKKHVDKLVEDQLGKGYVEVT